LTLNDPRGFKKGVTIEVFYKSFIIGYGYIPIFKKEAWFPKTLFQQRYRDAKFKLFENNVS
jgi:hypothetical protein